MEGGWNGGLPTIAHTAARRGDRKAGLNLKDENNKTRNRKETTEK